MQIKKQNLLILWLRLSWQERENIVWWNLRWHLLGAVGIFMLGQRIFEKVAA